MSEEKNIESLSTEKRVFNPPEEGRQNACVKSMAEYEAHYKRSMDDPEGYWADRATELLTWDKRWDKVMDCDLYKPEVKWFVGGKLNVSANCLDRHLTDGRRNKAAIIWQGEPEEDVKVYTYQMLHTAVCRCANVLKKLGVKKGDRVAVYLPMIPELAITLLACTRIGAVHSVVFAGFSAPSLKSRIQDCEAKVLIIADAVLRAGKTITLKTNVDDALLECPTITNTLVVKRGGNTINFKEGHDLWWHEAMTSADISDKCEPDINHENTRFVCFKISHCSGGDFYRLMQPEPADFYYQQRGCSEGGEYVS